ncbi:NAD(P)/FAD-dependent oxidoreductase [Bradyrhizobium sp. Leo121]|uniref:NAD(P)/FAD-dependent oxidoreductase n=1 Tax=Bradyrhizobium sp. Leo121 TaxID=1571195 RepID=UPI0010297B16|nr:NAD(P)/FAD-dependent oxidoreductase [Bradyrhizobium sp. Leo121]RZN28100.1 proton-conducting membrane transporter [Bradyrhizobium sp. Leo121]
MARILVLGAGFAGLWAAIGAARKRDEIGRAAEVEILVIDRNPYHNIRVRNYEVDLSEAAIPLGEVLDPIGVAHRLAEVQAIDAVKQQVTVAASDGPEVLTYDRLVLALGSELARPAIAGLAANGFDVDAYAAAVRLDAHLAALGAEAPSEARSTVVVVGAGFTGIEVATEMPGKLDRAGVTDGQRIVLIDPNPAVGVTIGDNARPVINEALLALGVETRLSVRVTAIEPNAIALSSGEIIPTRTVVWCAGMRASPLAEALDVERDRYGRVIVDQFMRVTGATNVFAAGDVACSFVDGVHASVMSCQFARPMGRFAGHNVVADLFGQPMLPLHIDWYVTVLDLGAWGALYTEGWDRQVRTSGAAAKVTKQTINHVRIYPPRTGDRAEILAAAAPTLQAPPAVRS